MTTPKIWKVTLDILAPNKLSATLCREACMDLLRALADEQDGDPSGYVTTSRIHRLDSPLDTEEA